MQTPDKKWDLVRVLGGFFSLTSGFVLIGVLNWGSAPYLPVSVALCLAGITLCLFGFSLLLVATADDPVPVAVDGTELGCVDLNGYYLVAYERETPDGKKQFRLASPRTLTAEHEAALIR